VELKKMIATDNTSHDCNFDADNESCSCSSNDIISSNDNYWHQW